MHAWGGRLVFPIPELSIVEVEAMKVVLFCGGYGLRMRSGASDDVPKPMAMVGPRPLIWHVMRYYAHFGHTEFILCLGYGAHHIKDFFLNYEETTSNDFVLRDGQTELLSTDIAYWTITFVQTGIESPIGERLRRVRHHLDGDEMFLANYADVLTDAPLPEMIDRFARRDAGASMMVVPPQSSFHCVELGEDGLVGGHHPGERTCRCGRTAATSCSARRSSTTSRRTGTWSPTAAPNWPSAAGWWRTSTAASGSRPTPSRSGPRSTTPTPGATVRGPCGNGTARGERAAAAASGTA